MWFSLSLPLLLFTRRRIFFDCVLLQDTQTQERRERESRVRVTPLPGQIIMKAPAGEPEKER